MLNKFFKRFLDNERRSISIEAAENEYVWVCANLWEAIDILDSKIDALKKEIENIRLKKLGDAPHGIMPAGEGTL